MSKYLAALLGLAVGVAVATEWLPLFAVESGGEWQMRRGSEAPRMLAGRPHLTAYVRLADGKRDSTFMAAVPTAHCGQPRGDVQLLTLDGAPIMAGVWAAGERTTGAQLARALCAKRK